MNTKHKDRTADMMTQHLESRYPGYNFNVKVSDDGRYYILKQFGNTIMTTDSDDALQTFESYISKYLIDI